MEPRSEFTCPKCGSHAWGTDMKANVGHCHGCKFTWPRGKDADASVGLVDEFSEFDVGSEEQ